MSAISVRLPESLHAQLRKYAEEDQTSINQFITIAVAEKIARMEAETFFNARISAKVSREEYLRLLEHAPDVEPEHEDDRLD
jgi:hypothetical protein